MASKLESDNPNWLFNVIDPKREDFAERAVSPDAKKEDRPQLAQWLIRYLKDYKLRYPQPTSAYSTEELQEMGYVGVYRA
jgi:hypothetical protein